MKRIIGLVGETGSGKDTLCDYIKGSFENVYCFRFSQPLSEVLGIFFDDIKKEDQQWLAISLRERFGNNILGEAIKKKVKDIESGIVILNGIRAVEEFEMIKGMGGVIIYVTADSKLRWERLQDRGEKKDDSSSYDKFLEIESAKPERQIKELGSRADFKIENNGTKEGFNEKIRGLVSKL
jgi:dephospho-CoA kinase